MPMKLVVIYPRPKDIQAFEIVYNRDHVPMAGRQTGRQKQDCGDRGTGLSGTPAAAASAQRQTFRSREKSLPIRCPDQHNAGRGATC